MAVARLTSQGRLVVDRTGAGVAERSELKPVAELQKRLGAHIRQRRKAVGLTVQQLADAAHLSHRMVTQVELGQANPSLNTVDSISQALGIDFQVLLAGAVPADALSINPPGQSQGAWISESGGRFVLQAATHLRPSAELWECNIPAGATIHAPADPPGSEVLVYVISGVLTLRVESSPAAKILAGGSARLVSDRAHEYINESDGPVKFVRVFQNGGA